LQNLKQQQKLIKEKNVGILAWLGTTLIVGLVFYLFLNWFVFLVPIAICVGIGVTAIYLGIKFGGLIGAILILIGIFSCYGGFVVAKETFTELGDKI
jgi:hypothetical protein